MSKTRRQVLLGFGTSIALAGCSGDSGGSTDTPTDTPTGTATPTDTPTPTPTDTPTATPEPASFQVEEYNIPETAALDENIDFTITVRNVGEKAGSASVPLYVQTPETSWEEVGELTIDNLEPGETTTLSVYDGASFDYINRYEFRLGRSSKTVIMQTVSAKISWGEEYTTPAGYRIRVDSPNLQNTYEYEDYSIQTEEVDKMESFSGNADPDPDQNIAEKEPDSGGQWAFVNVWVKNETGQTNYSPLASEFGLLYGNSQSDGDTLLIDEPINKGEPFEGGELQPGVERSGWIAYQLPGDLSVSDLTMAWSQDTINGEIAVNWGSQ